MLKGWEKVQHCQLNAKGDHVINTPEGNRLYIVLSGEFEYETFDKESQKGKRGLGGKKDFDIRQLLFARKKATIDDRRRILVSEE